MLARRWFILLILSLFLLLMGNVPAPYYACQGKAEGDPCQYGYGCSTNGVCRLSADCTDTTDNDLNECLTCRTGRAATAP
jgi:hypothetical protein